MKKLILAGACVLALTGCDAIKEMISSSEAPASAVVDPADEARESFSAEILIVPSADLAGRLAVPKGMTLELTDHGTWIISGKPEGQALPGGQTSGVSVELTNDQEASNANSRLSIKILARAVDAEKVTGRSAYSTNDVGNSGWRNFEFGSQYSEVAYGYVVPPLEKGRGDFIGILPNGTIEVAAIGIDNKERLPAPEPAAPAPVEGSPE